MTKRTIFSIVYDRERKRWVAKVGGMIVEVFNYKEQVLLQVKFVCVNLWEFRAVPCQIIIHTKSGKIAKEYTYGNDPKRSRG